MATDGSLVSRWGINVGQVHQREPDALHDLYMGFDVGDVSETDTEYTFTIRAGFKYGGYYNFAPFKIGYVAYDENDNKHSSDYTWSPIITETANTLYELTHTFTFTKPESQKIGIVPFCQLGCIENYAAGDLWKYGYPQGIMEMHSDSSGSAKYYTDSIWTLTHYKDDTKSNTQTLQCYSLIGNTNETDSKWSYSNASAIIDATHRVFVYDSDGMPRRVNKIYVYDSNKEPRLVKGLYVYTDSGAHKT